MAFFVRQDIGRVYVIKLTLPDNTVVHKIGMCHSDRSTDRMMELLKSWFTYFRFIPYTELKLDMQCQNAIGVEKYIHKILSPVRFTPTFKVEGRTEMFTEIAENRLIWFIKGIINSSYTNPPELTPKQCKILCNLLTVNYEH